MHQRAAERERELGVVDTSVDVLCLGEDRSEQRLRDRLVDEDRENRLG